MKRNIIYTTLLAGLMLFSSCSLDETPQGTLSEDQLNNAASADKLAIAAYAVLVQGDDMNSSFSLWEYGDTRSDDAYKGGAGAADGQVFHFQELEQGITTADWNLNDMWYRLYVCVGRANTALRVIEAVPDASYPLKQQRIAEMRFLRAHSLFLLKIMYKKIVIPTEDVDYDDYVKLSNVQYTNDGQWQKIADDFKFAYDNLPQAQQDKGRPSKYAAAAYLSKTYLYKAYHQDSENNEVTSINANDLDSVVKYSGIVMSQASISLETDYSFNFLPDYENGPESIWAIQYSTDDGTMYGNVNKGMELTVPQYLGCCDFHKPSQNLVNSFKTQNGLPMFNTYDNVNYDSSSDESDPRLFHTVAIPGFPYKYNLDYIYKENWNRAVSYYGVYASLKEQVDPECSCLKKLGGTYFASSLNHIILRFADVLLFRAEALIELNRESEALPLINQVRTRASNSNTFLSYAPNIKVTTYKDGVNCTWTQDFARQALRWERRLEFGMESSRFFDLVRWGIADQVMNAYYSSESKRRTFLSDGYVTKNKNEYCPVPLKQINYSKQLYQQNYGWK